MPWGISNKASEIEKIKADFADYLNGLNCTGNIDYSTYSEAFDLSHKLIDSAFELGRADLDKAVDEEREAIIEIVKNDCTNFNDQMYIIKNIRNRGKKC